MTNEELAQRIKAGETDLMGQLWEQTERLLRWMVDRQLVNIDKAERAEAAGVTREDLYQEAYFTLVAAVKAYDPETGFRLSSFMKYHVRNSVYNALGLQTKRTCMDPSVGAYSLDAPLPAGRKAEEDGEEKSFIENYGDPDSLAPFEAVEERDYRERLRQDLEESLADLTDRERSVIRARFYGGQTFEEIGAREGCSATRIKHIEQQALDHLKLMERLAGYREEIIDRYAYKSGDWRWFHTRTSGVELAAIRLVDMDRKARLVDRWSALRSIKEPEEGET